MTRLLRWSLRAYRGLLIVYPDNLRRDFGPEMLEAFTSDLSSECAAHGIRGAIRVWRITLREVIRIALPALLRTPAVVVSGLSAAACFISQSPLLIMTIRREAQRSLLPGDATSLDAVLALAIGAAITALTSFVVVHRWKRTNLLSLDICHPGLS
ncbi:MAG TPA: hypothetical protein VHY84_14705 [Bryobacteraceae bacterium]|nr:hypothetical protein [Bryobacteraceae bacterium]